MELGIPEFCLVVLIGASGAGKSTFAQRHFKPTEIISSDTCRAMLCDDETDQAVSADAFDLVYTIAAKRLALGRLTVIDATNVQAAARQPLMALARHYHVWPVAIVLQTPEKVCLERNVGRANRNFGDFVVKRQVDNLRRSLRTLRDEGFRVVYTITPEQVDAIEIVRQRAWSNRKTEHGPFDIIGDVHGCYPELERLLLELGYSINLTPGHNYGFTVTPPAGRRAVFVGDLVDRGPDSVGVLRLVMSMVETGAALCVPGNHDDKLARALAGRNVKQTHGLAETMQALVETDETFRQAVRRFIEAMVSHLIFDDGKLVVAHAGMKQELQGRMSKQVREFALYGETTGETDEFGLPVRYPWAKEYRGEGLVVYGHTPIPQPEWLNNTVDIDTGCAFGGALTALRYPEREFVQVPAFAQYAIPKRPLEYNATQLAAQQENDQVLNLSDFQGKLKLSTSLMSQITLREEQTAAALEVMSRFAIEPQWLMYLPPTMSPSETSQLDGFLEHPAEALDYYRRAGVNEVVCEAKHMGSRAIVIICRDSAVAQARFGVVGEQIGVCYTRTGRRFFNDPELETAFLQRVQQAISKLNWWESFDSGWFALDCELLPWSAKAQDLIRHQYAPVGAAATASISAAQTALQQTVTRLPESVELQALIAHTQLRQQAVQGYVDVYQHYCWPVQSLDDLRLAPFHLLACEQRPFYDRDHEWHMQTLATLAEAEPRLFIATEYRVVDLHDQAKVEQAIEWWQSLTAAGGEGMVVKPKQWVVQNARGLVQPAIKCRGPEYLRIIYGPEYDLPENLARLRKRGLSGKRSLALRELALGLEALDRFVNREPLRRVHECVFGVLALESEPVDPRL
ncbi:polynucleotide kinase-phosphatase [Herpetosiphon geysericola]|uniref:Metallophosphoesterase n=1 Tax=Herpetosiphon geysericola TaxID=70996 RepID=A0A0P6YUN7_9CHLR|nr:polynucleotide kinase-phosphatase [Herpetosiphon geysericola]KPL88815.1 metallophosphoesterase [Herpetosiphon geysericola]